MRADPDLLDRLVELLIRRDGAVALREKRVVGLRQRVAPDDPLRRRRDDDDPVVVAVGDHQVAGNRPVRYGRKADDLGGCRRNGCDHRTILPAPRRFPLEGTVKAWHRQGVRRFPSLALTLLASLAAAPSALGWTTLAGGVNNAVIPAMLVTQARTELVSFNTSPGTTVEVSRNRGTPRVLVTND